MAFFENTLKLTPPSHTEAPSGALLPAAIGANAAWARALRLVPGFLRSRVGPTNAPRVDAAGLNLDRHKRSDRGRRHEAVDAQVDNGHKPHQSAPLTVGLSPVQSP